MHFLEGPERVLYEGMMRQSMVVDVLSVRLESGVL